MILLNTSWNNKQTSVIIFMQLYVFITSRIAQYVDYGISMIMYAYTRYMQVPKRKQGILYRYLWSR